jgi:phosphatidylinositol 4-kinase type 2
MPRQSSSLDVRQNEENQNGPLSPPNVQASFWQPQDRSHGERSRSPQLHRKANSAFTTPTRNKVASRVSYDQPFRREHEVSTEPKRNRRVSFTTHRRTSTPFMAGDDDEGDLGYAVNEDLEANQRRVITERLEWVKARNPVFTWC